MSTAQVAGQTGAVPHRSPSRVPLARHVRVELRKLMDTRAGMWLLIAIALITLAAMTVLLFAGSPGALTYENFVTTTAVPQGILLPILGILAVTSEWSQRTGLVTFTLEPSRGRVITAKVIATLTLGALFVVLLLALAALGNVLGSSLQGGDGSWAFGAAGVRDIVLLQGLGLLGGFAFGMILLNSAAAIVASFALPIAFNLLFSLVPALQDSAPWIDAGTAQTPLQTHTMAGEPNAWWHLLVTSLWWIVIPLLVGAYRVLRSEVKSA